MATPTKSSLFTSAGEPRFLDSCDRQKFIDQAKTETVDVYMISKTLHDTGCTIHELLTLTESSVLLKDRALIIESAYPIAKKKTFELPSHRSRVIPIDLSLTMLYAARFKLPNVNRAGPNQQMRLWNISSHALSKIVKEVMLKAGIIGAKANPRGLRHSLPIHLLKEPHLLPVDIVKTIMGHTTLSATAKYLNLQMNRDDNLLFLNAINCD